MKGSSVVTKNVPALKIIRSYQHGNAEKRKYNLYIAVGGLGSVDPNKTAVMISENQGSISYGWHPDDNPDTLLLKIPYGNRLPVNNAGELIKQFTFGILRTNE